MNAIYKYRAWKFLPSRKNRLLFNIFLTSMAEIEGFHIFLFIRCRYYPSRVMGRHTDKSFPQSWEQYRRMTILSGMVTAFARRCMEFFGIYGAASEFVN